MERPRATNEFLSITDTATHLGMTERTVRSMLADGRLRGYRIGRTIRIARADIEAALVPFGGAA
jgi:excisionase family DNA binding protein